MNEILINAFVDAIKTGNMELNQVPIPYQEEVNNRLYHKENTTVREGETLDGE